MRRDEIIKLIEEAARTGQTELDLRGNQLSDLPAEIGQLSNLSTLNLSMNQLSDLPAEITQLSNLTTLHLSGNQLSELPAEIGQLSNLTTLHLSGNQLSDLLAEITQLSNLTTLNLSDNQLSELPTEIGQLSNLTTLDLSGNQLSELPAEIGQLSNLTTLNLWGNQLNELSAKIGQLANLTTLYLSENQLSELPAEIGQLSNLTTLDLWGNQLSELPAEIGQLSNLTTLDLWGNQLSELPAEITQLADLTTFNLSGNQLSKLPAEITQLANLTTLHLSGNQLSELSAEITQLSNLTTLHLSGNKLSELPAEITQLANLTTLHLSGNQLSELSTKITQLSNLTTLHLEENPLKSPPPEIAGQGVEAIFEYLCQLSEKETEATLVNEAKLILVGQGEVGKTCLAKRLIYDEFIEDKTTEGIDILKWPITAPTNEKEEIKLNVWDFGGQEIYHATHQFFLTKRSVYLLVWNARKSRDYEHIYYWLHTIEAFGEDSPIILVLSKLNERNDDLNMTDIREKFPQIIDLYKVDSEDGTGIPVLKNIISDTAWQLPHMQTPWIGSWLRVRELLEQNEKNWIGYNDFSQICQSEGLDEKQTEILDEYLHDLGVIIHFRDIKVQDMVILKPEWATKAFYKILDTNAIKEREGILLHSELGQIWDTSIYLNDIHSKLLELMNKFELVYELPDKKSHLVAELLPSTEPAFEWDTTDNLRFYYRYEFLPAGVMTRFIVRIHQDLEKRSDGTQLCWREGAVLCRDGTRAFVRIRPLEKLIEISVDGSNKKELLPIIRYHFDEINKSIKKVKITKEIPCSCSIDCSYQFDYERLLAAKKRGKNTVECQLSWEDVPISLLLDGYQRKKNFDSNEKVGNITNYYNYGQAGIIGPDAHAHDMNFNQIWLETGDKIDLSTLASELVELQSKLIKEATEPEHYSSLAEIGHAENSAKKGDGAKALEHLSKASKWTLDIAEKIGVPVAIDALKMVLIGTA
jgi:internalin A